MPAEARRWRLAAPLALAIAAMPDRAAAQASPPETFGPPAPLHGPPAPPEPWPSPRAILAREFNAILAGRVPDLQRLPLVERLRQALARTDLAGDILTGGVEARIAGFRTERESGFEARKRMLEIVLYLSQPGRPLQTRPLIIEFDATQGEWQVSEIRDRAGNSLRRDLQLNPPRQGLP